MFESLNLKISEYCENNKISGVIRVTVKDKIIFEKSIGFANIEKREPFTENSMFSLYSLSKPFCAIGLMKLKDRDLVDIDKHPSEYLEEAKGFDDRLTIRHLLYHTSGMPDFEQVNEFAEKHAPGYPSYIREHLKLLSKYPQYFPPGKHGRYANINYIIPALIIENISGYKYAKYMKKEVFEPFGMKSAVVDNEKLIIPNRVQGYDLINGAVMPIDKSHDWMLGAGDIVGTVDDVYCLNKAIKNKSMLKSETWEEILTPSPINGMGLGCTLVPWHDKKRITHNGGHLGFRTYHVQLPDEDFDIIILSNSGYGKARFDIADLIYDEFFGKKDNTMLELDKGYI